MVLIALKRLWNRPLLTLLSILGVVLAIGLVTSIPILTEALSFAMLQDEKDIYKMSAVFIGALVIAQIVVILSALRSGMFQALRMGDRE